MKKVDEGTDYTDRITVTEDSNSETLTIHAVKLSDEREFFCQVNGMAAGNSERKTHLMVFGKYSKQGDLLERGYPSFSSMPGPTVWCLTVSLFVQIPQRPL